MRILSFVCICTHIHIFIYHFIIVINYCTIYQLELGTIIFWSLFSVYISYLIKVFFFCCFFNLFRKYFNLVIYSYKAVICYFVYDGVPVTTYLHIDAHPANMQSSLGSEMTRYPGVHTPKGMGSLPQPPHLHGDGEDPASRVAATCTSDSRSLPPPPSPGAPTQ